MQVSKISLKNNYELEFIADFLKAYTKRAYLVGGSVRDLLLGYEIYDFDIEIYDVKPDIFDDLMKKIGANGFGKSFFVYKFKNYDLALARSENKVAHGHKGFEVSLCDDEKKASKRRDFTINSMMINIFNDEFLDFYAGLDDLKAGILRHIDDESFKEDSLRVFRAVHFVSRFHLTVASESIKLMQSMDTSDLSKDRINAELYKFFKAPQLVLGFELLQRLNLEQRVFLTDTKAHTQSQKFKQKLAEARNFIKDEALFLYLYLNFFEIEMKTFFKQTGLKKELYQKAKQPFFKDKMSDDDFASLALKMPLCKWLGLWDKERIQRAKALKLYDKALKADIDIKKLQKQGFEGKNLGVKIEMLKKEWIKNYIQEKR